MKIEVQGVPILVAELQKFEALTRREKTVAVNRTALDVHREEINQLNAKTKRHTGRLAQIAVAFPEQGTAVVEPTAPYAEYIEYGTRPHRIRARNKRVLAARQGGFSKNGIRYGIYTIFGTEVQHPGTAARPFVAPAAEYGERQLMKYLEAALDKALAK